MKKILLLTLICLSASIRAQDIKTDSMAIQENGKTEYLYKYTFCLLNTGPNRNQDSVQTQEIQKGHMAHIQKMSDSGILVAAGPFDWNESDGPEPWRGIFIFKTDYETAEKMAQQDPAIRSGRLKLECKAWWSGQKW